MNRIREEPELWKPSSLASAAATKLTSFWSGKQKINQQYEGRAERAMVEETEISGISISLSTITTSNVEAFRNLNLYLFPVVYNDSFYKDILFKHPILLSRLAQLNDGTVIGAVACRKEVYMNETRVYIMTLGVLSVYRRGGLETSLANESGSLLLTRILEACQDDPSIDHVCLHVHVSNEPAIAFYQRIGFVVYRKEHDYYLKNPGVEPPDAYFLRYNLKRR